MTHDCTARARDQVQVVARELDADPRCLAVDVIDPATDPTDRWTIDAVVRGDDGLHPALVSVLAEYGLTIHAFRPRGEYWNLVAVA